MKLSSPLSAKLAQLGTAFVACPESNAPQLAFPAQNAVTGKLIAKLDAEAIESIQKLKGILHES